MVDVRRVPARKAIEFVKKYHYSNSCSAGVARYGLYEGDELLAVSIYDRGTYPMQKAVFGKEYAELVRHFHRLAVHPKAPKNTASRMISASLRLLHEDLPEVRAVVTYADLCLRHTGGVYRATNALYTGITTKGTLKFVTNDFRILGSTSLKGSWSERRDEAHARGWKEVVCQGKLRFVYLLGSKTDKKVFRNKLKLEVISSIPDIPDSEMGQLEIFTGRYHGV